MLICLDVDYREQTTVCACAGFAAWDSKTTTFETTRQTGKARQYQPGEFYLRELPCLLDVLRVLPMPPSLIIVDGYAWLGDGRKGLGAHLFDSIGGATPVVGVAKNRFHSANDAIEITRGTSDRPLFVTSVGLDPRVAADGVRSMAGPHRIPSMLKLVDRLCREM